MVKPDAAKSHVPDSDGTKLPAHIAVIMDGNGRWARKRGLPRIAGHRKGADTVRKLITLCGKKQIPYLTLFAFSSENWKRPQHEVDRLMELFIAVLDKDVSELHQNNVCFRVIGDRAALKPNIVEKIVKGEKLTYGNTGLQLNVAINYGGQWDLVNACRKIVEDTLQGKQTSESVNIEKLQAGLSTAGQPDPDLFIRTGGEHRISNFLLLQLAYTELYFTDVLWPDFNEAKFELALEVYAGRQRRFGRTGEQMEAR